jgi:hypothetical protein
MTRSSLLYLSPQSCISCVRWDPTGQLLASCAAGDSALKLWAAGSEGLLLVHTLLHPAPPGVSRPGVKGSGVTVLEWCHALGKGDQRHLMIARYVYIIQLLSMRSIHCFMDPTESASNIDGQHEEPAPSYDFQVRKHSDTRDQCHLMMAR